MADNYESFYYGSTSPLDPSYGELFIGYRVPAGRIGAPTSIQTADQIREVSSRLSEGIKTVELQPIQPEIFETIPKQHMKEIQRLGKLTGTETTIHAPIIEPSGITEHQGWNEAFREAAERRLFSVVDRAHELNPHGNIPVTIHASAVSGPEYMKTKEGAVKVYDVAIEQETGQMTPLRREEAFYPGMEKEMVTKTPEQQLEMMNRGMWSSEVSKLIVLKKHGDEMLERIKPNLILMQQKRDSGEGLTREDEEKIGADIMKVRTFYSNVEAGFRPLFSKAYRFMGRDEEEKKVGRAVLDQISRDWEVLSKNNPHSLSYSLMESEVLDNTFRAVESLGTGIQLKIGDKEQVFHDIFPQFYKPIEKFSLEKSAQTFGDIAFKAYEKYKDTAPMICLENPPVGSAFAKAEKMRELIDKSREKFVEVAKAKGYSASEARGIAEKMIGATWDVGHINMLRRGGFTKEDIVKEAREIAPYVKHMHLTDNFGYQDTHLPVGMGEVPIKEILKEMEKAGFSGKEIMEAGGFVQHFKTSPHPFALEALGSPMYAAYMQPFWNQARATYGAYSSGYGTMLPEQHFSMYGAGFSGMPSELGGQIPGKQSRLSGAPME